MKLNHLNIHIFEKQISAQCLNLPVYRARTPGDQVFVIITIEEFYE